MVWSGAQGGEDPGRGLPLRCYVLGSYLILEKGRPLRLPPVVFEDNQAMIDVTHELAEML
jgi:hypothetical protein